MKQTIISPHCDDAPLTFGGRMIGWKESGVNASVITVFTRSGYTDKYPEKSRPKTAGGVLDDADYRKWVDRISNTRQEEDRNCIFGYLGFPIEFLDKQENGTRGYRLKQASSGFVYGSGKIDWQKDQELFEALVEKCEEELKNHKGINIPIGPSHVDHILLRMAILKAIKNVGENLKADVFFGEDQPYIGLARPDDPELSEMRSLIHSLSLVPVTYPIELGHKLHLLDFYPSQTNELYYRGVLNRAFQLAEEECSESPMERIYKYPKREIIRI